ncbi:MAG TPA: 4-alpha-glucanotransferase [Acidimicrobiia bacterium]|nr:4-alpha-glucanotransferase [Acidimicrobiia bacterium]
MPPRIRQQTRSSGLLLHITSLPGEYGIGDLGLEAHRFVADIAGAGQRYWQVLPVGPVGRGNSPYSSTSTFAGNPLLISLEQLGEIGLIDAGELDEMRLPNDGRTLYDRVRVHKTTALSRAARRFADRADPMSIDRFEAFRTDHGKVWLDQFCLYSAARQTLGLLPSDLREAGLGPAGSERLRSELGDEIEANRVIQFLFFEQWQSLRETCAANGIAIVGDLPLYVAFDSADLWAHPENFLLDASGAPAFVAGVPPDYFSETGQRWGNPLYDWDHMASSGFSWWRARVAHALSMYDLVRIDHFRGIAAYWRIPAGDPTAITGRWSPGPGAALLQALEREVDGLPLIAEDLGLITDDVTALRDHFGLPGMRVAQFGFDEPDDASIHHPSRYPEDVWAYTGTHDNDTTVGWFWQGNPQTNWRHLPDDRQTLWRAARGDVAGHLIEMVARSRASNVVFPVQDLLRLGTEARMNTPGTPAGNWEWRLQRGQLTEDALAQLLEVTRNTDRLADQT